MARTHQPDQPAPDTSTTDARVVFDDYPERPWSAAADPRYVSPEDVIAARLAEENDRG